MIERIFGSAKSGIVALLCVLFAQVGAASYSVQVTAGQDRDKGTVSVVKRPGSGSQADSSVSIFLSSEGESAVISAIPAHGYKFDRWTLDMIGGGVDATYLYEAEHTVNYSDYSSVAGLSIVQCLASFSGKDVAVNLDANTASGHVSPIRVSCVFGEVYPDLPGPTATGLRFVDWYDAPSDGSLVEPGSTVVARSDEHTLYARWEPMKYMVTFDPGEGKIESGPESMVVTYADKYPTLPVPVLDRYDFVGWFTAPVNGKEVLAGDVVAITKDATLYARWQIKESEIEYTITLDGSGATKPGTRSVLLKKGAKIEGVVLPERTGYAFAGYWSAPEASGVCYVKSDGSPDRGWDGTADATVYAAWAPNTYKVHYFPNGGVGSVVATNVRYDVSFKLAGNIFSRFDGATFAGWRRSDGSGEYAGGAEVVNLAASGSVCLLAVWEPLADELNASGICDDLVVTTSAGEQAWNVIEDGPSLKSGVLKEGRQPSELRATVSGPGTVSFSWCAVGTTSNTVFQVGDGEGYSRLEFSGPLGFGNWQPATKIIDRTAYAVSGGAIVWRSSLYREEPSYEIIDHTLYVKDVVWRPSGYSKVVFNLNDGGAGAEFGGGDSMTVPYGAKYGDIPDPVRSDRMFVGWTTNGVASGVINPATTVVLPADHELTALWDVEHMGALVPDASFAGADITYYYDGSGRTINVAALKAAFESYGGVTFAYSTSRTGPWSATPPAQTHPGSLVTFYQASAEGYDSYFGWATVSVVYRPKVLVRVTGPSKTVPYDGNEKALSGYDLEILYDNGLYSAAYFTFSGVSSLAETGVGVYRYGLSPRQFANKNPHFKDVVFEIVADGTLEIQPVADVTAKEDVVKLNRGKNVDSAVGAYFSVFSDRLVKSATASGLPAGVSLEKGADGYALSGSPTQTGAFDATLVFTLADGTVLTDGIRFLVDDGAGKYVLVPATGSVGADVTAKYDGAAHTIAADSVVAAFLAYDGAKVEYSAAASGPWSSTPPAQTEPGSLATYYVVSAEGYDPVTNSATVTVTRKYMVTLDPGEGRFKGDNVIVVEHGGTYPELPNPARDRYDFQGWFTSAAGGTKVSEGDAVKLSDDTTLHAHWQLADLEVEYTITLDTCGATKSGTESVRLKRGMKIEGVALPEKTGYTFNGYWANSDGTGRRYVMPDGSAGLKWEGSADETIYASWTPNKYKVHYFANGGVGPVVTQLVQYDSSFSILANPFTSLSGVEFAHWSLADGSERYNQGASVSNLIASGSVCLLAEWDQPLNPSGALPPGYSRVAFDLNDGGTGAQFGGCSLIVPYGENYGDVPDPNWAGHDFLGWTTNGVMSGIINPENTAVPGVDHALVALWTTAGANVLSPAADYVGADVEYGYDGIGHSIDVDYLASAFSAYKGVTITYARALGDQWEADPPLQTHAGSLATYYRVQADGYADYTGCSTVKVADPSKVKVKVTGPSATFIYDGDERTLSGFDLEIENGFGIYTEADIEFAGVSNLAASAAGVYSYGLKPDQFANKNDSFKDVAFEIVADGKLTILPKEKVQVPGQAVKLPLGTEVNANTGAYFIVVSSKLVKSATASGLPAGVRLERSAGGYFLSGAPTQTGAFDATLAFILEDGTVLSGEIRFLVSDGGGKYVLSPADGFGGASVTAEYDGAAHTIDTNALIAAYAAYGGVTIKYSSSGSGPWSPAPPMQTAPGKLTAHYRVSAEGYADIYASATVTVTRHYAVTLNPGEGRLLGDDIIVVEYGGKYPELPQPSRDRYDFKGWWTTAAGGTQIAKGDSVNLSGDIMLYAHWQLNGVDYTITLDNCGATSPGTQSLIARTDSELGGIELPKRIGYAFSGYWSEPNGAGKCYISSNGLAVAKWSGTSNETIYAAWTPNVYKVYYLPNGEVGAPYAAEVRYGDEFQLAANRFVSLSGKSFIGWQFADGSVSNADTKVCNLAVAGSVCLQAKWSAQDELNASGVCHNLSVTTSSGKQAWSVTNVVIGGSNIICLVSGETKSGVRSELKANVGGSGALNFSWCATGVTKNSKTFIDNNNNRTSFNGELGLGAWVDVTCQITGTGGEVIWRKAYDASSDDDTGDNHTLYLKDVSWIPEGNYDISFDLADGGAGATFAGGMRSMTVVSPNTYGDLPDPEWAGHEFIGWTTNGVESGMMEDPVATVIQPLRHTLTALWKNKIPVALEPAAGYPSADVEYAYDGAIHTINTNALAAAFSKYDNIKLAYSDSPDGPWSASPSALAELGSLTTHIKASADGYEPYFTSARVKVVWDKKVVVNVTGASATYDFDGTEKSLAGFGVEISGGGGLYTVADFSFNGISNCVGTAVGEYTYALEPSQFSNQNPNFPDVVFRIVSSGHLSILPVSLVPGAGFDGADVEYDYDGSGRTINTNALAAAFSHQGGVSLTYAASPDGPWTVAPPEFFGIGNAVTYVKASADGCEDFVTSAVVRVGCDSPVVVRIIGPTKTCYFDEGVKTLSGFDIEIPGWEDLYPVSAISFSGVSNLTESAIGEYSYGLMPGQFANLDPDFTDVSFEIVSDGTLEIISQPRLTMKAGAFDLERGKNVDSSSGAYFSLSYPDSRSVSSYSVTGLPPGVAVYRQSGGYVLSGAPSQSGGFDATFRFVLSDGVVLSGVAKFRVHGEASAPKKFAPSEGFDDVSGDFAYDGTMRTIDTNALAAAFSAYDGASFTYSNSSGGPWSITPPVLNGLGSLTTYIKASADGYDDFVTSAVVRVVHDAKVLVKITGPSAMYDYDGSVKRLSGLEVEIEDEYGLYIVNDFAFNGVSNLTESAIGEYFYGLKPEQFANLNQDFSDIVFRIVADGHLAIQPAPVKPLVPAAGFDGADAEFAYDGTGGRTINTNALAAAFPGATLAYAASPDGPWTAAPPELWGLGSLVTYVKASADGYSVFVTSAVVKVVCDSPVAVRVSGPSKAYYFDGDEKTLSGFDIEISGGYGLYSVHAFRFDGVSNLTETAVGEYAYGLKPGQFTNLDADFTKVSFEIKSDGALKILPGPEVNFVDSTFDLELNKPVDSEYGAYFTITSDRPVASGVARGLPAGVSLIRREGGNFVLSGAPSKTGSFEATLEFVLDDGTGFSGAATFRVESHEVKPKHLVPAAGFSGADADYDYDGAAHTIDTNALAAAFAEYGGVKLEYAASSNGPWSVAAPAFAGPGSVVVYCRASGDGYDVFTTSAVVRVVCSAPVTVKVTGPSKIYVFDGTARRLSGFAVEILDGSGLYTVGDFSFSGKSNLVATAAGVYVYGLKPGQFANRNAYFSNVAFKIVSDGRLEIEEREEPEPALGPLWSDDGDYDGSAVRTYDGWAMAADGSLAAVIQVKASKLRTKTVTDRATKVKTKVTISSVTATVNNGGAKKLKYTKGVGDETGEVTGLVCTAKGAAVESFGVTLGADNLYGEWGGYEIFGARNGMGVKGDKMAASLESYRGDWTIVLTNAAGTTSLQLTVGARGATKISGVAAGGFKVNAKVQAVMGEDGLYIPYLAALKRGSTSYVASLLVKLAPDGSIDVVTSSLGALADSHGGTEPIVISLVIETGDGAGVPLEQGATLQFSVGIAQRISLGVVGQDGVETTLKAKGLPTGLKLVKSKAGGAGGAAATVYAIEGVPKKAQAAKQVILTATNKSKWGGEFSFNVEVVALPAAAIGTYDGFVTAADGAESTGAFKLKLTSAGKVTGNFNLGGKRVAFKAMSLDRIEETTGGFVVKIAYKLNGVQYVDDEILIALDPDEGVYCAALLSSPSGVLADAVAYRGR